MKFNTEMAQKAYEQLVGEVGRAVQELIDESRKQAKLHPNEAVSIALTAATSAAEIKIRGLDKALRLGAEIDVQMGNLKAHIMMAADGK